MQRPPSQNKDAFYFLISPRLHHLISVTGSHLIHAKTRTFFSQMLKYSKLTLSFGELVSMELMVKHSRNSTV